jgi:hypothetical protein
MVLLILLPLIASGQQLDPTRPFGAVVSVNSEEKKPALVLQSIIQRNQSQKAVINGQVLIVGDKFQDFELVAIHSKGVVLHSSQGRMELSLFSGVIAN